MNKVPKDFFNRDWRKKINFSKRQRRFERRLEEGRYSDPKALRSAKNSFYRSSLKHDATKAEIKFGDYLWCNKIYFIFQKGFFYPFHRIADFYLPHHNLIIEIDGGYHLRIKKKDEAKDKLWLEYRGIRSLRFTNEQVMNGEFVPLLTEILEP